RTGVPVRAALRALPPRDAAILDFGLNPERKTLLAMGGSQGARAINQALIDLARDSGVPPGWQLLVVSGEREYDRVRRELPADDAVVRPYLDDPSAGYAVADLVLARAGASTLAELAASGKPAILVPYPFASDDHQTANAARFEESGAGIVVTDQDVQRGRLRAAVAEATSPARIAALRAAAQHLRAGDAVATILARVDWLAARKTSL
ncbi:MAG: UDP-N-acetylglucosamine--N-acetylmuramyl-(pentapeptide) pyrophosphoryl-undecaprenol N-acetylglucosamine transferase, partial [Candidatus Tumulicola sp.]